MLSGSSSTHGIQGEVLTTLLQGSTGAEFGALFVVCSGTRLSRD